MDSFFIGHIKDLSDRSSQKNIYTYTNFLNTDEQNEVLSNKRVLTHFEMFGGAEGCERKMLRFGNEEELYYSEAYPIVCIKAEPLNIKFADSLTHRDILGALMNLSIERENIGDIIVKQDCSYIFVTEKMSNFICENLKRIKHTDIKCTISEFNNDESLFSLEEKALISSSLRADCVICAVYNLSRSVADNLFNAKKIYINSAQCENPSKLLKENDTVSVRGYGKFIFRKEISQTKKGRLKILIDVYI